MTEDEKTKAIDKANHYQQMFELWAWKDFMNNLKEREARAFNDFKSIDIKEASLFEMGILRGILQLADDIRADLHFIVGSVDLHK